MPSNGRCSGPMGGAPGPLHDPGNHRAVERRSDRQAARRGRLTRPADPAGDQRDTARRHHHRGHDHVRSLRFPRVPFRRHVVFDPGWNDSTSLDGAADVAFTAYDRLGLREFMDFEAQSHTPSDRCVRFAVAVTDACATLRYRAARYGLTRAGLPPAGARQLLLVSTNTDVTISAIYKCHRHCDRDRAAGGREAPGAAPDRRPQRGRVKPLPAFVTERASACSARRTAQPTLKRRASR
jgi:hypothetical protein